MAAISPQHLVGRFTEAARRPGRAIALATVVLWSAIVVAVISFGSSGDRSRSSEGAVSSAIPAVIAAPPGERTTFSQPLPVDTELGRRAADFASGLRTGRPFGWIVAPSVGLYRRVYEGGAQRTLLKGPVHYPRTSVPGEQGLVALAGDSRADEDPFRRIGSLEPGDPIYMRMVYGTVRYEVQTRTAADRTDTSVFATPGDRLVLTRPASSGDPDRRSVVIAVPAAP